MRLVDAVDEIANTAASVAAAEPSLRAKCTPQRYPQFNLISNEIDASLDGRQRTHLRQDADDSVAALEPRAEELAKCGRSSPRSFARRGGRRSVVGQQSNPSEAQHGGRQSSPKLVAWPGEVHLALWPIRRTQSLEQRTGAAPRRHAENRIRGGKTPHRASVSDVVRIQLPFPAAQDAA